MLMTRSRRILVRMKFRRRSFWVEGVWLVRLDFRSEIVKLRMDFSNWVKQPSGG